MSSFRGAKNAGWYGSNLAQPIRIACNFIVDNSNGNGLGIRSLKSNGWIKNVFMHTTASPGTNNGATNPNPAAGFALVQFKQNFNIYLGGTTGFVSPAVASPTPASSTTAYTPCVISSLGTATVAQWQAVGLPSGVTPSVGVAFVPTASQSIGGSATVLNVDHSTGIGTSGIFAVEVIGSTDLTTNSSIAANGGEYVLVQFLNASGAITAPANGSVGGLFFEFDQSSADPIMQNGDPTET